MGLGREKKTNINFYYREWTGIRSDRAQQGERLDWIVQHWRVLAAEDRDLLCLGDANLCTMKWNDPNYSDKELANKIQDFNLEEDIVQLMNEPTRTNLRLNIIDKSCIDHISTSVPGKCSDAVVISDHL